MAIVGAAMQIAFWTIVLPTAIYVLINLFGGFFYGIGVMLFQVMDLLQSIFRKLAGLGTVYVDGEAVEGDILSYIMKSDVVIDVLISVTVFALGLVILGSIIQMIRLEYTTEGSKNSKDKIFTTALKSLLMFVMIPVVCFVGIRLSNYLLQAVDYATSSSGASTVSGSVFMASTSEASKVYSEDNWGQGADIGALLTSLFNGRDYNNAKVIVADGEAKIQHFENTFKVSSSEQNSGESNYWEGDFTGAKDKGKSRQRLAKMVGERFVAAKVDEEGMITIGTPLAGLKDTPWDGTCLEKGDTLSYLDIESVGYFYNTGNINYLTLYLGCYICIKALFNAAMGMIARIYKVVALFVIAPATIGLQPIDDGSAYKSWKKSFIQNVLSCYGFIVALNLYFMVVGVLQTVELWQNAWLANCFMQFLFVLTGATMIKDLSSMFAGLIGAADAMADGEKATGEVGKIAGSVAKVGMGAVAGGAAAFKGLKSMYDKNKKVDDGKGGKTSVKAEQSKIDAYNKSKAEFDKEYEFDADTGKYMDKTTGAELSGTRLADAQSKKLAYDNLEAGKKDAEEKFASSKDLATKSAQAAAGRVSAGQSWNRFSTMVKGSGLMSTVNNLTGNIGSYVSGEAYKGADEKYQKDLKEKGVDVEKYAPKAGTSTYSRLTDKAKDKIADKTGLSRDTAESVTRLSTGAEIRVQDQAARRMENDSYHAAEKEKIAHLKEMNGKRADVDTRIANMQHAHSNIGNTFTYNAQNMDAMNQFMEEQYKTFTSGGMGQAAFKKALESVFDASTGQAKGSLAGYAGNSAIENMLKEMHTALSHYNPSAGFGVKGVRDEMLRSANLNIDAAEIEAKANDAANNTAVYGTFKERQEYQNAIKARDGINANITETEAAWTATKTAHETLQREAIMDPKKYAEEMAKAVGDKFKDANEKLAQLLQNEGIKAQFGDDQKFKINDQPIVEALKRVQQSIKEAADKANAGKDGKTLDKILEQLKKNGSSK